MKLGVFLVNEGLVVVARSIIAFLTLLVFARLLGKQLYNHRLDRGIPVGRPRKQGLAALGRSGSLDGGGVGYSDCQHQVQGRLQNFHG